MDNEMDDQTFRRLMRSPLTRRQFLGAAGMTTALLLAGRQASSVTANNSAKLPSDPFTLGVASGDPAPDGVVLWTRLAPGGVTWDSTRSRDVLWQVATDSRFTNIVQRGSALALPQLAHSVHIELSGLRPAAFYYYRFLIDGYVSRTGRLKTAPMTDAPTNLVKFAFCSCSDFQNGYFVAYADMAKQDLDFWVHLGDYIYEYDAETNAVGGRQHSVTDYQAAHNGTGIDQLSTLADYRRRYTQYHQEPSLQTLHATHPLIAVWDDHETENNYSNTHDEIGDRVAAANGSSAPYQAPMQFLLQRASAYQAYYENMPLRRTHLIANSDGTIDWKNAHLYRRLQFGDLLTLHMLDDRQYRTDQPRSFGTAADGPLAPVKSGLAVNDFGLSPYTGVNDSADSADAGLPNTLLGKTQFGWLLDGITKSTTKWNTLGNQTMMGVTDFNADYIHGNKLFLSPTVGVPVPVFDIDSWDGYSSERAALLGTVAALRKSGEERNVVVITGDIHSSWVHNLQSAPNPADWGNLSSTVATEFVTSSVTADFPPAFWGPVELGFQKNDQPWVKYVNPRKKGYVLCTVTPAQFQTDYRLVDSDPVTGKVVSATANVSTAKSFTVLDGIPGAQS